MIGRVPSDPSKREMMKLMKLRLVFLSGNCVGGHSGASYFERVRGVNHICGEIIVYHFRDVQELLISDYFFIAFNISFQCSAR